MSNQKEKIMKKKELSKQFPWISEGSMVYQLSHVRKDYKTERGFMNHLAKMNAENERKYCMPDIKKLNISIVWKRSRTWGYNPHARWSCWFKDGTFMNGIETASGCGYDKHSTVVASVFNVVARGMLFRKRNSRKEAPYGICNAGKGASKKYFPSFSGGVGMSSYERIVDFLGGKIETHSGETFDYHVITFK